MASTYLDLHFHIVFATKHRAPLIGVEWRPQLHAYLAGTLRNLKTVPLQIGGTADHVHILVGFNATHAMENVVREIKKTSSSWAKEDGREPTFAWQEGYGAFSVSAERRPTLSRYILNQEKHHEELTSEEELRQLLREAGVAYDPRYFE